MDCPDCSSGHTEIIESRLCTNGTRRRRHACLTCGKRWTTWDGDRPEPAQACRARRRTPTRKNRPPLDEHQVRRVLLAGRDVSNAQLARELDVSRETIRQIRLGMVYAKVCPEIARQAAAAPPPVVEGPSCYSCGHWRDGCTFGFPDWQDIGPTFAAECHLYAAA